MYTAADTTTTLQLLKTNLPMQDLANTAYATCVRPHMQSPTYSQAIPYTVGPMLQDAQLHSQPHN